MLVLIPPRQTQGLACGASWSDRMVDQVKEIREVHTASKDL